LLILSLRELMLTPFENHLFSERPMEALAYTQNQWFRESATIGFSEPVCGVAYSFTAFTRKKNHTGRPISFLNLTIRFLLVR